MMSRDCAGKRDAFEFESRPAFEPVFDHDGSDLGRDDVQLGRCRMVARAYVLEI